MLAALLYVTFLQVPIRQLARAWSNGRFVAAALVVNFLAVPVVVAGLLPLLPDDPAVRLGVLLVLLCPCVDYVIVFTGLAGGDHRQLLAITPLLLLVQMIALPGYLLAFDGPSGLTDEVRPFLKALVTLIVLPLVLAALSQAALSSERLATIGITMVPLMALTLLIVVASQVPELDDLGQVLPVVPVFGLFLVVMAGDGVGVARLFRCDPARSRAVVFTGATRNSLVVLPLALALPEPLSAAAVVVVTQTLVEVIGMVVYLHVVPRLVPG